MPLTIRIESLREVLRVGEQERASLIQVEEEGIAQVAALQLMRERGTSSIETNGQDGESQTITYDSALLRTLCIPVDQQLFIAEMLAALQVKATEAQISCLTAAVAKGRETVLLGDIQRKTRWFAQADAHISPMQRRIQQLRGELENTEEAILAKPDERAIVWYRKKNRLLDEREAPLKKVISRIAASADKAREQAAISDLPDFAVEVAFRSGLIQGTQSSLDLLPDEDQTRLITNLAARLAKQIKFV